MLFCGTSAACWTTLRRSPTTAPHSGKPGRLGWQSMLCSVFLRTMLTSRLPPPMPMPCSQLRDAAGSPAGLMPQLQLQVRKNFPYFLKACLEPCIFIDGTDGWAELRPFGAGV